MIPPVGYDAKGVVYVDFPTGYPAPGGDRKIRGVRAPWAGSVLQRPTLVLNRHWQPVHVATVARVAGAALEPGRPRRGSRDFQLYSWADWAKLTPREDELFVRTVRFRLRVPEVLTLTRHDRPRHNAVTFSRRNLFKRDHTTCQYCGGRPGTEELTIDHVIPRAQGGADHLGELRAGVRCLQREEGQPDSRTGQHEAPAAPVRPAWKPLYDASTRADRKLVPVPQRRLLERPARGCSLSGDITGAEAEPMVPRVSRGRRGQLALHRLESACRNGDPRTRT